MGDFGKKCFKWGGVCFVGYYLITYPSGAAHVVQGTFGAATLLGSSLSEFVSDLHPADFRPAKDDGSADSPHRNLHHHSHYSRYDSRE